MITIVVVDDHKIVRQGIKMLLQREGDFQIIGETANGFEALQLIDNRHPDVVVTDLSMDGMNGIELCRKARESSPDTRCVILSMHADVSYVNDALRSGARGYVLKENGVDDLVHAVRNIIAGQIFISPFLIARAHRDSPFIDPYIGQKTCVSGEGSIVASMQAQIEELREIAFIDELTEVGNRRYAEISLRTKIDEFRRYNWPFGVILADIDNFKKVNDTYGHEAGDKVLQMVASTVSGNIRSPDSSFFRWGGEEFLVIASNVEAHHLFEVSERIRGLVGDLMLHRDNEIIRVTISAGAAMVEINDVASEIIRRADRMLYISKKEGRNRTTIYHAEAVL